MRDRERVRRKDERQTGGVKSEHLLLLAVEMLLHKNLNRKHQQLHHTTPESANQGSGYLANLACATS